MLGKIIAVLFAIAILAFAGMVFYQNLPQAPIQLKFNGTGSEEIEIVEYGATPVFAKNMRFSHNNISYRIDSSCSEKRRAKMVEAFDIFEAKIGIISFYEDGKSSADILIGCSDSFINLGENLFAAGEGGPSRIINTTRFKTIEEGKISLYRESPCDYPSVELHELLHVFGFNHSEDPSSIMYPISKCDQRITADMIETLRDLYIIVPLPDAVIHELTAVKRGRYLDFNITVLNEGLIPIENMTLSILADGKEIETIYLNEIGVGYGRTLRATNIRLPSLGVEVVGFAVDYENEVLEFDEKNNLAEMTI